MKYYIQIHSLTRNFSRVLALALVVVLAGCAATRAWVQPPQSGDQEAVKSFAPPVPEEWKLANGLTVLFLADQELPLVRGRLFFKGGSLLLGSDKATSLIAMGDQMRQGGAGKRSADQLDLDLERLSANVNSSYGQEFGSVGFSGLSTEFLTIFKIFADVVLQPRFESDRLDLWKGQAVESIRRRVEDPSTVASISSAQLLYADTPYGRVATDKEILAVSRATIVDLHQKFVRPDQAILAIAGNVTRQQVESAINEAFGNWKARDASLGELPEITKEAEPGIYFIELPFAQATVQIGHLGVPRLTPDYPAIEIFNQIFGSSGFGSRLMKRVRTERGLSYVVYGGISPGVVKGTNSIVLQTKAETLAEAVETSIETLEQMQNTEPLSSEIGDAKSAVKNSFVFNFDSPEAIIGRAARQRLLSYPDDFDAQYLTKIDLVKSSDVLEVAKKRWDKSRFVIVVVGNSSAYSSIENATKKTTGPISGMKITKLRFNQVLVRE